MAQTIDQDIEGAATVLGSLEDAGLDMGRVGRKLEDQHVANAARAYKAAIAAVGTKGRSELCSLRVSRTPGALLGST